MKTSWGKIRNRAVTLFNRFYTLCILGITLIILSIGFFRVLWPSFREIQNQGTLNLQKAQEQEIVLKQHLAELLQARKNYENFSKQQIHKLRQILPEGGDLPALFVQAHDYAAKNKMVLSSIDIIEREKEPADNQAKGAGQDQESQDEVSQLDGIKLLTISLDVTEGDYQDLKNFISDLEHNLRLFDIVSINFGSIEGGPYLITIKTYYFP